MPFDDPTTRVEIDVPNKEEIAILEKMTELLSTPSTWCKSRYERPRKHGPSYCLAGALRVAVLGKDANSREDLLNIQVIKWSEAADTVWDRLDSHTPKGAVVFNDNLNTTHADIRSLLIRTKASFE